MTTKLPHDKSGFLIGERLVSGMDAAARDLNDIRDLLQLTASKRGQAETKAQATLEAIERNTRRTRDIGVSGGVAAAGISRRAHEVGETAGLRGRSAPAQVRERDERGRFLPTGGAESGKTEKAELKRAGILSSLVSAVRGRMGGVPDTENLDPTLSALHEARQLVGPFARVGGMMFKAGGWLMGRGKKGDELPKEQRRHNRIIEKLLKRIAGEGGAHGGGGSLFGGLFSSLSGLLRPLKFLMRGGMAGLGSGLLRPLKFLMRGGMAGLGIAGAWLGGQAIGKWIYDKFEPQISAVADAIGSSVKTAIAAYDKAVTAASSGIEWIADKLGLLKDAPKNAYDAAVDKVSAGMQKLGDAMGFNPAGTGRGPAPKTEQQLRNNPVGKDRYNSLMQDAYGKMGYTPDQMAVLKGMVHQESGFNPDALSPKGAFGMTQFMEGTAKQYGVKRGNTEDAVRSQLVGQARYMRDLLGQFGGDWDKARAAYNYGPGNLQKLISRYGDDWSIHLPRETADYLRKTKVYASKYTGDFTAAAAGNVNSAYRPADDMKMPDMAMIGSRVAARAASIPMPGSTNPPGTGVMKIPPAPKVQQQVGGNKGWTVVNAGVGGDINQNVSDRALAHALTGGLGMDNARWP